MKGYGIWLNGLAAFVLLAPLSAGADGNKSLSANLETGVAAITSQKDIKKVNEYSSLRTTNGFNPYGKIDLNVHQSGIVFDGNLRYMDSQDQDHSANLDLMRVFKSDFSYSVLNHWLDHDKMLYINAAVPPASSYTGSATNPLPLTPQNVPGFWNYIPGSSTPGYGSAAAVTIPGVRSQQIGRASTYGEDLTPNAVFAVKRTEWTSKNDLTIPQLPNVTFHFNYRNEDRNGMKQSIGMSKCTSCHVTGQSKNINENTRDITAGATGKFGLFTVDYSYLNRQFRENAAAPVRYYDPALSPGSIVPGYGTTAAAQFDNRLLYDYRDGLLRYDETPDSNKNSHIVKAKLDLPKNISVMASYVNSKVDSSKTGDPGIFSFNGSNSTTLNSRYESYGGKISSVFWDRLTLNLRGRAERVRSDDVGVAFSVIGKPLPATAPNNFVPSTSSLHREYESASNLDTVNVGLDAVYRLAIKTTLRVGYDYKLEERQDHHLGDTTTHSVTASLNTRPTSTLSGRILANYQIIDNPYHNPNAALSPFTNNTTGSGVGTGPTYGVSLYDERTANLSNQPENVFNGKVSLTWAPVTYFSATAVYNLKTEDNKLNSSKWSQTTNGPGISFWVAPTQKLNMTLTYNYLNQHSGTAFCQGWYDG